MGPLTLEEMVRTLAAVVAERFDSFGEFEKEMLNHLSPVYFREGREFIEDVRLKCRD